MMDKTRARRLLRTLHRDAGHFVVGLTIVYALSGLAVNHIGDWDPNFTEIHRELTTELPSEREAMITVVSSELGYESPDDVYGLGEGRWELIYGESTVTADTGAGTIREEGREPRFLLRALNYLHLNRGKAAWTYVADLYAVLLLFLALGGVLMLPMQKGLLGRPGALLLLGIGLPIAFVTLSGCAGSQPVIPPEAAGPETAARAPIDISGHPAGHPDGHIFGVAEDSDMDAFRQLCAVDGGEIIRTYDTFFTCTEVGPEAREFLESLGLDEPMLRTLKLDEDGLASGVALVNPVGLAPIDVSRTFSRLLDAARSSLGQPAFVENEIDSHSSRWFVGGTVTTVFTIRRSSSHTSEAGILIEWRQR